MKPARDLRRILDSIARRVRTGAPARLVVRGSRTPAAPLLYGRALPRLAASVSCPREPFGPRVALADVVRGREASAPDGGTAFLSVTRVPPPCAPPPNVGDLLFLDIETTGLSCSPLFLIGAMTWEGGELEVRQYLARDYSEEETVISLFHPDAGSRRRLVTFNGKSFDVPYIRMRAAATGVPIRLDHPHTDLLHLARRTWGHDLPDCRLQTLELLVLGRHRRDDIPGRDIPDAYHAYVRTGDAAEIARILEHNLRDLVTLAELMERLGE